jgi:hypothetical protein
MHQEHRCREEDPVILHIQPSNATICKLKIFHSLTDEDGLRQMSENRAKNSFD